MDEKPPHWILQPGDGGMSPLHNAACSEGLEGVRALVEEGFDVNAQDDFGWTPVIWCIDMAATSPVGGAEEIVDYFFSQGAKLEYRDETYPDIVAFAESKDPGIAAHVAKLLGR